MEMSIRYDRPGGFSEENPEKNMEKMPENRTEAILSGRRVFSVTAVAFTEQGRVLARNVRKRWSQREDWALVWEESAKLTKEQFDASDLLIFFCASGIAVRKIAPFLRDKTSDPAVLVTGEKGHHVISLLSGHLGGANRYAVEVAEILGGEPVITTATDGRNMTAPDLWADRHGLAIKDMKMAKKITAELLRMQDFKHQFAEWSRGQKQPCGQQISERAEPEGSASLYRICIPGDGADTGPKEPGILSITEECDPEKTLILEPKRYVLGIGCRRDTDAQIMEDFVKDVLRENDLPEHLVEKICSIDLKKEEYCIRRLARALKAPYVVFTPEELMTAKGDFISSSFVEKITGADNICERSAVLGASSDSSSSSAAGLIIRKTVKDGMTLAAAERPSRQSGTKIMTLEEWSRAAEEKTL